MCNNILLVEEEGRESLNRIRSAERRGYRVLRCVRGIEVRETLESEQETSIVVADPEFRDESGLDGISIAREIIEGHDLPIVFLLDRGDGELLERCAHIPHYGVVLRDAGEPLFFHTVSHAIARFQERRVLERRLETVRPQEPGDSDGIDEGKDEQIEFLAETAYELIDMNAPQDLYSYIARSLRRLNPDAYVVVNSIDQDTATLKTEAVLGIGPYIEGVVRLLGFHPEGKTYRFDASIEELRGGRVSEFAGGLHELTFGQIPKAVARRVEQALGIRKIYGIAFLVERNIYANAVLLFPKGRDVRHPQIVETFARQAAIALKRRDAEQELHNSRRSLEQSNEEKDLLMKELNHRVKNNLHMISSLISLKSAELGNAVDLSDVRNQVDAIRILHEKLYESERVTGIDMRGYLEDLLRTVISTKMARHVEVVSDIEAVQLSTRIAIPLGLIVNEIATNALKYGFSDDGTGKFTVRLRSLSQGADEAVTGGGEGSTGGGVSTGGEGSTAGGVSTGGERVGNGYCELVLSNTGRPFPGDVDLSSPKTLGMRLISSLTKQIDGSIELERRPYPTFRITFPTDELFKK